jgi:hypothetical protein
MKEARMDGHDERTNALHALKLAILSGATWHYEQLVASAIKAGATDDEIAVLVHKALEVLFASAEQPVTARQLAHLRSGDRHRR